MTTEAILLGYYFFLDIYWIILATFHYTEQLRTKRERNSIQHLHMLTCQVRVVLQPVFTTSFISCKVEEFMPHKHVTWRNWDLLQNHFLRQFGPSSLEVEQKPVRTKENIQYSSFWAGDSLEDSRRLFIPVLVVVLDTLFLCSASGQSVPFALCEQCQQICPPQITDIEGQQPCTVYMQGRPMSTPAHFLIIVYKVLHQLSPGWGVLHPACIPISFVHPRTLVHYWTPDLPGVLRLWDVISAEHGVHKAVFRSLRAKRGVVWQETHYTCWWEMHDGEMSAKYFGTACPWQIISQWYTENNHSLKLWEGASDKIYQYTFELLDWSITSPKGDSEPPCPTSSLQGLLHSHNQERLLHDIYSRWKLVTEGAWSAVSHAVLSTGSNSQLC